MNKQGRPKVAEEDKRVNYTCTISPVTRQRITAMRQQGVKIKLGRIIDKIVDDMCREQ